MNSNTTERQIFLGKADELDGLLNLGFRIIPSLAIDINDTQEGQSLQYAIAIFEKLLFHAISLRRLLPPAETVELSQWDLSSVCALSRCILEAYEAMAYIALHRVSKEEQAFRLVLWKAHDCERRLQMMCLVPDNDVTRGKQWLDGARAELENSLFFQRLDLKKQIWILKNLPPYHISHELICKASGVDYDYYNLAKMFMSQYVHTASFALHHLSYHEPSTEDGFRNLSVPVTHALVFLSKAITDIINRFCPSFTVTERESVMLSDYCFFTIGLGTST